MADVSSSLKNWSTTPAGNSPAGGTAVGTGLAPNLQQIQATVRQDLANASSDVASAASTDLGAVTSNYCRVTGTTTITSFGTVSAGIWKYVRFAGALTLTHNATSLILPGGTNITTAAGDIGIFVSEGSGNWRCVSWSPAAAQTGKLPSSQIFTSGSGTYTTPTGALYIRVRMIGGGGGGAGGGTTGATAGGAGGDTTFSTLTAGGGGGGATAGGTGAGGSGGTATNGDINVAGTAGQAVLTTSQLATGEIGGSGASSAFGGGGAAGLHAGQPGASPGANSGAGGGGGGGSSSGTSSGAGGGAGGYVEKLITAPSATYSYAVGAAGTAGNAGTGGGAGAAGAAGLVIVDEFYS